MDNKKITTLVPDELRNDLQSYGMVRYIFGVCGYCAFILEVYIVYDIILICFTVGGFIYKVS